MTTYGFLGLGIMGKPMATNLLKAGFEVTVWNRTQERCNSLIDMGALQGKSPAAVVEHCDITFAAVSDPEAAKAICFGPEGALKGISDGKGYIDITTVDAETAIEIHDAISAEGGLYLEAPVTGSKKPAEDGQLVFLCGGNEELFDKAREALEVMGKKTYFFPRIGQGAKMKLIVNMILGTVMTSFAEGLALGDKAGLEPTDIIDVLGQGAVNTPMFQLKGPLMATGNFNPAFPLKHMQKDMRLVLQMADNAAQPLVTASAANSSYIRARSKDCDEEDFSAVLKAIKS